VGIGAVIGLALAIPTGLALASEPFYLENADPVAFGAALAVFGASIAAAALWPAFQALNSNPVDALRHS
jgi:ABC-type antimicrobial peptide transport system permease subunit